MSNSLGLAVPHLLWVTAVDLCLMALPGGPANSFSQGNRPASPQKLTFNKDVATIVFEHCSVCHHPGGPGPFSLLDYQSVKKRARDIARVTQSRYMPPWLPAPGYGEFSGDLRLADEQIRTIQSWLEQGEVEGAPAELPPVPNYRESWQLGEPDLVVTMPRPYHLVASGSDVFRNFVIPAPVTAARYVKALEILPGTPKVVHHANLLIDRTGTARRLDGQGPEPGFDGVQPVFESEDFEPQTHFLFWKPGAAPAVESDDKAWRLDKGTDLVLNMHMQPSGKPEAIQARLGLYFSTRPPTKFPMLLQLEHDGAIDISPGQKDFVITDDFRLPLEVQVLGVYPHAHYLGKEIQGFATLPDGTKKWLVWIKNWDINWQAVYRYKEPIFLPKGTVLSMRWIYDNSRDNIRNPSHPPKRVRAGNRSSDEMGHLWVQVLPRKEDDRKVLQEALMRQRLRKYPYDFEAHFNLGAILQSMGRLEESIAHLSEALAIRPENATAHNNLGAALQAMGKLNDAADHFRAALRSRPDYTDAHYNLGNLLLAREKPEEAAEHFREVLKIKPEDAGAENGLGSSLLMEGKPGEAAAHYERALRINPNHAFAQYNLGYVLAREGKLKEAAAHLERALEISPNDSDTHNELGSVYAGLGNFTQAIFHFERALRINPENTSAQKNLEQARAEIRKGH